MALKECKRCGQIVIIGKWMPDKFNCIDPSCGGRYRRIPCEYCGGVRHVKLRRVGLVKVACCPPCKVKMEEK